MFRIPVVLVALTIMTSSSTALAIDCLGYLAADTALEKPTTTPTLPIGKPFKQLKRLGRKRVQHREAPWQEAGKAALRLCPMPTPPTKTPWRPPIVTYAKPRRMRMLVGSWL